jgi:hypothetical protein
MTSLTIATRGYLTDQVSCIATHGYICILLDVWQEIIQFTMNITQSKTFNTER